MDILYILLVLLVVTRIGAEIAHRMGQAALVGELIAGVILGVVAHQFSATFPVISEIGEDRVFRAITDLGIFFLMLLAGIELQPKEFVAGSGTAAAVALGAVGVPLASGLAIGWIFLPESELKLAQSLFIGVAMSVTGIPVVVKVLLDLGKLRSQLGKTIVSAAVFADVFSQVVLAVLMGVIRSGGLPDLSTVGVLIFKVGAFFAIAVAIGVLGFPKAARLLKRARIEEFEFSALLIAALAYALLAEMLELHFIVGTFLAGLFFSHQTPDEPTFQDVERKMSGITLGFLAPAFFASIGLHLDFTSLLDIPGFVVLLTGVALASKLVGAGIPALLAGAGRYDAVTIGIGMSGRGAVALVIADVALNAGLFSAPAGADTVVSSLFSAVVVMAIATTLVLPIGLRLVMRDET